MRSVQVRWGGNGNIEPLGVLVFHLQRGILQCLSFICREGHSKACLSSAGRDTPMLAFHLQGVQGEVHQNPHRRPALSSNSHQTLPPSLPRSLPPSLPTVLHRTMPRSMPFMPMLWDEMPRASQLPSLPTPCPLVTRPRIRLPVSSVTEKGGREGREGGQSDLRDELFTNAKTFDERS